MSDLPVPKKWRVWIGKDGLRYTDKYGGITNIEAMEILNKEWGRRFREKLARSALAERLNKEDE